MTSERIIKCYAIYNPRRHRIRSTYQSGRLNVFDWRPHAESVSLEEDEKIIPVYILIDTDDLEEIK